LIGTVENDNQNDGCWLCRKVADWLAVQTEEKSASLATGLNAVTIATLSHAGLFWLLGN
jgi:hypothetical protein